MHASGVVLEVSAVLATVAWGSSPLLCSTLLLPQSDPPPCTPQSHPQVYPLPQPSIEADEEALLPRRKALHRLLGLPPNRPLLRLANAADLAAGGAGAGAGLAAALTAGGTGGKPRLQVSPIRTGPMHAERASAGLMHTLGIRPAGRMLLHRLHAAHPALPRTPCAGRAPGAAAAAHRGQRAHGAGVLRLLPLYAGTPFLLLCACVCGRGWGRVCERLLSVRAVKGHALPATATSAARSPIEPARRCVPPTCAVPPALSRRTACRTSLMTRAGAAPTARCRRLSAGSGSSATPTSPCRATGARGPLACVFAGGWASRPPTAPRAAARPLA